MNIFKKTWELLHYFEWNVAIRPHYEGDYQGKAHPYRVIKNTWRYWCADPFLFAHNGKTYLFVEAFDKVNGKGMIGYRVLEGNKISKLHICMDLEHHLSYPYVYRRDDEIYMLPECFESGRLTAYRATAFPDRWEPAEVLLEDMCVCDSNYLNEDGTQLLLTMPLAGQPFVYDKLDLYVKQEGKWQAFSGNPVVCDASRARNAGGLFRHCGKLIRPSQNCADSYGEALVLNQVLELSDQGYREEKMEEIRISDVGYTGRKRFDGIHTLNVTQQYDVIDLRISSKLQPQRFVYLLKSHFKRGSV